MNLAEAQELEPMIVPDAEQINLDEIGLYGVGYQYRGQVEKYFPLGWSGGFEPMTGVALQPAGVQNGRTAVLLHPPWRGGTGVAFQEFRFQLPPAAAIKGITLVGAIAMRADAMAGPGEKPKSDGATFRIFVNGQARLDEHRADSIWKPFTIDLSALAGQIVTLRFETDPGPHDNSAFDFALWGGRELVLTGFVAKPTRTLGRLPPLDLRRLYSRPNDEVAPVSGYTGTTTVAVSHQTAVLTYSGADGILQYQWTCPDASENSPLGKWQLVATPCGAKKPDVVTFARDARLDWIHKAELIGSQMTAASNGAVCISTYAVNGQKVTLTCLAKLIGKSLALEVVCNQPEIAAFDAGRWGPVLHRQPVAVPYYSGQIYFLAKEDLFVNAFLDWTGASASYHDNTSAVYGERTDGTRESLHERVIFSAAWNLPEVLPNIPNLASPFREHLAGKIILDIWGGRFDDIAKNLEMLHDYGLNQCVAIIHDWQRSGYDNALPAHVPANANLGGDVAMKHLVATAKRLGYDIALHENYVDYYPDYEGFHTNDIALDSHGNRELAWFNPGTKIQSFAVQPHAILPLAQSQSPQIVARYAPNADYLDVHSAVPPWFHVDYRADREGAGTFQPTWQTHRKLWAYERELYRGPVFGEGANHWFWSGLLDGVEAQFGVGWPGSAGQTAPLFVDFDLLKIHPLQFNHGMGYYERWWQKPSWHGLPPMVVLDQYRMQEIAYGHAGFLGGATYAVIPLAWLEHHLMTPVTSRYATARATNIQYRVHDHWVASGVAARARVWRQVRAVYDNGLTVIANDAPKPLEESGCVLPQYGWLAKGAGVTAWTALCQGVVADFAETADSTFANARPARDWNQSGIHQIRPSVSAFHQTGARAFVVRYQWQANETLPRDYHCFVHFVADGKIVMQDDHPLAQPSSTWRSGQTVEDGPHEIKWPADLPDGDYDLRMGLYLPEGGRLALLGQDDGESRIQTGTVHIRDGGSAISFQKAGPDDGDADAIYSQHLNLKNAVLDFGDLRTDGSVLVRRERDEWVLRPFPRDREFLLELKTKRFGRPATVRSLNGATQEISPEANGDFWRLKLNGAAEYRWKPSAL